MSKMTLFKKWMYTKRCEFSSLPVAVIEAGFVDKLPVKINPFFGLTCSHVTRERSYLSLSVQQTCIGK